MARKIEIAIRATGEVISRHNSFDGTDAEALTAFEWSRARMDYDHIDIADLIVKAVDLCECCDSAPVWMDGVCKDCAHPDDIEFMEYDPGEDF